MATINHAQFFELSVDLLCVANTKGYFLDVNPNFCAALGYTKQELLSKPYTDFIHPDDLAKTDQQIDRSRAGKDISYFTNRYRRKDGEYIHLSWTARTDTKDKLIYATARDISDTLDQQLYHDQVEKALIDSTIYVETDPQGVITKVNDEFCKISGYSAEELIGNTHAIVSSGDHSDAFFQKLWETITSGHIWSGTLKNRKKDGSIYFVKTLISPIYSKEAKISKYIAIRQDITDTVDAANALTKANKILNETSAIAKVGGWELDVATGELNWTDETFAILEVEKKQDSKPMLPEGLALFTESSAPIIDRAVSRAIELGEPYSLELEALTAKGNVKWVYTNGRATYKDGKVVSLSGTIQDIDKRKKTELAYQIERQKSIHNSKMASLGELASSMAHEVNNPLGIISGNAELLMEIDDIPDASRTRVETILRSTQRISHIVQGLKKFSGNRDSAFKTKDLSEVVEEAYTLAKPRLKVERINVSQAYEKGLNILCNEIEIEQVVLNLINNAIDAITGLPDMWIKIRTALEGSKACVYIEDSGSGVSPESVSKIFDPFYSTKETSSNTGLGLSISREIVLEHDGAIELATEYETTCFKLSFPLVDQVT